MPHQWKERGFGRPLSARYCDFVDLRDMQRVNEFSYSASDQTDQVGSFVHSYINSKALSSRVLTWSNFCGSDSVNVMYGSATVGFFLSFSVLELYQIENSAESTSTPVSHSFDYYKIVKSGNEAHLIVAGDFLVVVFGFTRLCGRFLRENPLPFVKWSRYRGNDSFSGRSWSCSFTRRRSGLRFKILMRTEIHHW